LGEFGEFVTVGGELVELDREVADALAAGAFVEGVVLEGVEVAVDGGAGGGDLGGEDVDLRGLPWLSLARRAYSAARASVIRSVWV